MDISELISKQAEGIAKSVMMPSASVTSFDKEMSSKKKKKKRKVFKTRVFFIIDDISAEKYSEFIDEAMSGNLGIEIIREVENWTKEGELIRVVDYVIANQ